MITLVDALVSLVPDAEWGVDHTVNGDVIRWLDTEQTEPTQSEIDAEVTRLQAEYDSQAYARNRKAEYEQLNQFEMQFDDQRDNTTTWVDSINEIKARFPK